MYSHTEPNTSFAPDERSREFDLISSAPSCNISILHLNIRGFLSHKSELEARIRLMPSLPTLICLNETFLDKSLDNIVLNGYSLISRRDRQDDSGWGGICCFALTDFASNIVCISTSSEAERQWHVLHISCKSFLLVNQYRLPHHSEISSIDSLEDELSIFSLDVFGIIMI